MLMSLVPIYVVQGGPRNLVQTDPVEEVRMSVGFDRVPLPPFVLIHSLISVNLFRQLPHPPDLYQRRLR